MYRNFFLFERQVSELNRLLLNFRINNCFTHRKDELVLWLVNDKEYFLRISVNKKFPYVLLYNPQNIKTHHTEFFTDIKGSEISDISIKPFDKLVRINCGHLIVECTFYGSSPNIVLLDKKGRRVDQFKKNIDNSDKKQIQEYLDPFAIQKETVADFIANHSDFKVEYFMKRFIGGFNTLLSKELAFRCSLKLNSPLSSLNESDAENITKNLAEMIREMQNTPALVYERDGFPHYLSILPLTHLGKNYHKKTYPSLNEAWKQFVNFFQITQRFNRIKSHSQNALKRRIDYLMRTLSNISQSEDVEQKKKAAELKGNLLLTFVHQVPKGSAEVTLNNIFSDPPQTISIKLDPKKSVAENAQVYFKKYKDINRTKMQMRIRRRTYERELDENKKLAGTLSDSTSMKELLKIQTKLIDAGIIQSQVDKKVTGDERKEYFKHALLDHNWEVLVGRNARNNDFLTFKFAGKYDLWFHAQGVSGSHVILRRGNKSKQPPPSILVQVAQIAAYFSAARTNTTVAVMYTEVRYVRKPRKTPAGFVTTSNSQTIFVTPKNLI